MSRLLSIEQTDIANYSECDCFSMVFEDMIKLVVTETNRYAGIAVKIVELSMESVIRNCTLTFASKSIIKTLFET